MTADERALADIVRQIETAWNASDSVSFAALFVEDANFIRINGGQLDGRTAIEASHRTIFDTIYKNSYATFTVRRIRFLRPDVAIVFTDAHVKFYESKEPREVDARPTLIVVKERAKWQVVALQNTKISEIPVAAGAASRPAS